MEFRKIEWNLLEKDTNILTSEIYIRGYLDINYSIRTEFDRSEYPFRKYIYLNMSGYGLSADKSEECNSIEEAKEIAQKHFELLAERIVDKLLVIEE